jgi:hypothetical protein
MLTPIADGNITTGQVVTQCIFAATFPGGTAGVAIRSALEAFVMADLCRRQAANAGSDFYSRIGASYCTSGSPPHS